MRPAARVRVLDHFSSVVAAPKSGIAGDPLDSSSAFRPPPNTFPQIDPLSCPPAFAFAFAFESPLASPLPRPLPVSGPPAIAITGGGGGGAVNRVNIMLIPSITANRNPPNAADRAALGNPYLSCSAPPVAAPLMIGFHGSSFLRAATSAQSNALNSPPQTANEPPIRGASRRIASAALASANPLGALYAPLTRLTTPPPTAPIANAPPRSSKILCGHGSRPWSTDAMATRASRSAGDRVTSAATLTRASDRGRRAARDASDASAGETSMSAAKKALKAAEKVTKKRPDPSALDAIARGMAAMRVKAYGEAKAAFESAEAICATTTVRAEAKAKEGGEGGKAKAKTNAKANAAETQDALDATHLPKPGSEGHVTAKQKENLPPGAKNYAINSVAAMADHLAATGGKWRTRFPPEPNGYLHIGHAKAMYFDFGVARKRGGETILRFDDTNPAAEKQEYIDSIISSVKWLGHEPAATTYSSDYFDKLYEFAVDLIKSGNAYVCFQNKEQTFNSRKLLQSFQKMCADGGLPRYETPLPEGAESPWRNTSVEENLSLFEKMKNREFKEGECCLRMKGDLRSDIPSMWDLAAYRIKYETHPHSGDKWCIYPTYDYTHCLVDSLENITHSLCTLEFESRQAPNGSYYWLLDALDTYKPVTWEFSRCNITYNVMSKRKLNTLVTKGYVNGWDDPRLLTLEGLRRRGYTPSAINKFCASLGVTRHDNTQPISRLENVVRDEMKDSASRYFAVLDPVKVNITNHPGGELMCEAPVHPSFAERGMRRIDLKPTIFIERSDFKTEDVDGYFGLAPGKTVRLQFGYNITCTDFKTHDDGSVSEINATIDMESRAAKPPKGILHWATPDFVKGECRLYNNLFTVEIPGKVDANAEQSNAPTATATDAVEGDAEEDEEDDGSVDWLTQINPESLVVHRDALLEPGLIEFASKPLETQVQLQRLGFFTFDNDSTADAPVLNRIVTLKESASRKTLGK